MRIAIGLSIAGFSFLAIYRQHPPAVAPANAPALEFSAARALKQLAEISEEPHPIGSPAHAQVRDYLLQELTAQGLTPQVQRTTAVNPVWKGEFRAGTVENVIAKLPGAANSKAVMLVGHYDSVPWGVGASDDGAAVAALLETLRALKAGPVLNNDVIFLFTDGEESGLLGANAFVAEHPWAKDVGVVLNFEARGNGGPTIMFETSNQNGWLIGEFARSAPYPVAHSLAYEIYRLLPNDTDLTVFKRANLPGLNFAFISGLTRYHTQLDSLNELDPRSLQHHGSYALALARHFGNLDLRNPRAPAAIYFDLLGATLVHYSGAWVLPLTIVTTLAFGGVLFAGFRRRRLTIPGLAWGLVALLSTLIIAAAAVMLLWNLVLRLKDVAGVRGQGEAYQSNLFFISFVSLTLAISATLYIFFRRKASIENLTAGSLLIWLIILWFTSLLLPGASYLPTWLLLFSLPTLGYMVLAKEMPASSPGFLGLLFLGPLPVLILLVPVIYQTYLGLTLRLIGGVIALVVLLLGSLIPHLKLISKDQKWLLPGAMSLIFLGFLGAAIFASDYDAQQPKMDTMMYGWDAASGKSIWASGDGRADEWTSRFFRGGKIQIGPLREFFAANSTRPFASVATTTVPLNAPDITLLDDLQKDGGRSLRLRITSAREAPLIEIYLDSAAEVRGFSVNGRSVETKHGSGFNELTNVWSLRYYNLPPEGIELAMDIKAPEAIKLRAVDQSYGLPQLPDNTAGPRPNGLIPSFYPFNDSTLVSKSFVF
ncbi:MAG TPA: M20/M25/M40 family metallo-hydrolase [Pyrinomonadaceae bacterium]|nr:M20/M25/M40 family metallo-hydrolase [Pyrinomonadaceae bacterium]